MPPLATIPPCFLLGAVEGVLVCYMAFYMVMNIWKPWGVAATADLMGKKRRTLVLSVDALLKTLLEFIMAPAIGYVASTYSIDAVFFGLAGIFLLLNHLFLFGGWGERGAANDPGADYTGAEGSMSKEPSALKAAI
jgi:hypothetical protein